jgi:hypothetical protein
MWFGKEDWHSGRSEVRVVRWRQVLRGRDQRVGVVQVPVSSGELSIIRRRRGAGARGREGSTLLDRLYGQALNTVFWRVDFTGHPLYWPDRGLKMAFTGRGKRLWAGGFFFC